MFIFNERVQVNPDNYSLAEFVNIFIIQIEYTEKKTCQSLSQPKPWCDDSSVLNLHHDNDIKEVVLSQPSITLYKSANQKIVIPTVYES